MDARRTAMFRFRYSPPFDWHGPRPEVEAFRCKEMTTIIYGQTRVDLDAGEWLLQSRDGSLETMPDRTFRAWYRPCDDDAASELAGERPRPRRRPHRRTRGDSRAAQARLNL